jgi:hypothetical protein
MTKNETSSRFFLIINIFFQVLIAIASRVWMGAPDEFLIF